jgi:hypothetical protein
METAVAARARRRSATSRWAAPFAWCRRRGQRLEPAAHPPRGPTLPSLDPGQVLPAWHDAPLPLGGEPPEEVPASPLLWAAELRAANAPPPPPPESTCGLSLRVDLAAARRASADAAAAPMLEVAAPRLPCKSGEPALSAPWSTAAVEATLTSAERERLGALQLACPAFFAPRGARVRDRWHEPKVDWIHKRRAIRDKAPAVQPCACTA